MAARSFSFLAMAGLLALSGCAATPASQPEANAEATSEPAPVAERPAPVAPADETAAAPASSSSTEVSLGARGPFDDLMDEYAQESTLRRKAASSVSNYYYTEGREAYDALDFREARARFQDALDADPDNEAAFEALQQTQALLGERYATVKMVADEMVARRQAARDQKRIELERLFEAGMAAMDRGRYQDAITSFERILEEIRWYRHLLDADGPVLGERVQAAIDEVQAERGG